MNLLRNSRERKDPTWMKCPAWAGPGQAALRWLPGKVERKATKEMKKEEKEEKGGILMESGFKILWHSPSDAFLTEHYLFYVASNLNLSMIMFIILPQPEQRIVKKSILILSIGAAGSDPLTI